MWLKLKVLLFSPESEGKTWEKYDQFYPKIGSFERPPIPNCGKVYTVGEADLSPAQHQSWPSQGAKLNFTEVFCIITPVTSTGTCTATRKVPTVGGLKL